MAARSGGSSAQIADLRRRIDALDEKVARLKRQVRANGSKKELPWWREVAGRFDGDRVFNEIVKEGRRWREGQRKKSRGRYWTSTSRLRGSSPD